MNVLCLSIFSIYMLFMAGCDLKISVPDSASLTIESNGSGEDPLDYVDAGPAFWDGDEVDTPVADTCGLEFDHCLEEGVDEDACGESLNTCVETLSDEPIAPEGEEEFGPADGEEIADEGEPCPAMEGDEGFDEQTPGEAEPIETAGCSDAYDHCVESGDEGCDESYDSCMEPGDDEGALPLPVESEEA